MLWVLANQNSVFPPECSFPGGDNRIIGVLLASWEMMTDKKSLEIRVIQNELSSLEINFYFEARGRIEEISNKAQCSPPNLNKPRRLGEGHLCVLGESPAKQERGQCPFAIIGGR